MKKFLKIISAVLSLLTVALLLFAGCDKDGKDGKDDYCDTGAFISKPDYSQLDLSEYIKLGEYKGLTVDTSNYSVSDDIVLWNTIIQNAEIIKYPSDALDYYKEQTRLRYQHYADEGNMSYDELLSSLGLTQNDVTAEAQRYVKEDLVQLAIVKAEGIELTDGERSKFLDKYVSQYVKVYGYSEEYVRTNLTNEIYDSMLYDKMLEYLMMNNTLIHAEE